jgi:hypothetical protein
MYYVKVDSTSQGVVPFNKPLQQTCMTFRCTWHRLPADLLDWNAPGPWLVRMLGEAAAGDVTWMNTVNKTAIWGFDPGTLLVTAWEPERRSMPFGTYEYDVHFTMVWRPQGHNFLFYNDLDDAGASGYFFVAREEPTGTLTYEAPGSVTDGVSLFNEREFRDLFKVQA